MLKITILVAVGVVLWNSYNARQVTSDVLQTVAEILRPRDSEFQERRSLGQVIDEILGDP